MARERAALARPAPVEAPSQGPLYLPPGTAQVEAGRDWAGVSIGLVLVVEVLGVAAAAAWTRSVWPGWGAVIVVAAWAVLLAVPLGAGRVHGHREPDGDERARLAEPWRDVQRRAGTSAHRLVVVDSSELNACASFGRTVAVTADSARSLPPFRLAAVLAHELGHVRGRQAGMAFVRAQVTLPGRALLWTLRAPWSPVAAMWRRAVKWHRPIGFVLAFFAAVAAAAVSAVVAAPALAGGAAAVAARLTGGLAERRADAFAVRTGLGAELLAAVEHRIDGADPMPLPLVKRAEALRRRLG
ncbi:M48 family metalloprotease [Actinomadura chibensis]|uniref:M48 family metalloprotease n=1 Tax=Actinomadura chibensis TaxID=392828 RepID=UPI001651D2F8|nr:M48 family metalloprotease [Actinomadura chibensis]